MASDKVELPRAGWYGGQTEADTAERHAFFHTHGADPDGWNDDELDAWLDLMARQRERNDGQE